MFSLYEKALQTTTSNQDAVSFMTSVSYFQSFRNESSNISPKHIQDLVTTTTTQFRGLQMLELCLQQNYDVFKQSNWFDVLITLLKDPSSAICKEKVLNIFILLINYWAKDPKEHQEQIKILGPVLVDHAKSDMEFKVTAFRCLSTIAKYFPFTLIRYEEILRSLILDETHTLSSKHFEMYAECFSYLPNIQRTAAPDCYKESWNFEYNRVLTSIKYLMNLLLTYVPDDEKFQLPEDERVLPFANQYEEADEFGKQMIVIRQFINYCRILAKLLSTKSKHPVQVPFKTTLDTFKPMFQPKRICKLHSTTLENQVVLSHLVHIQIAALTVLEPLFINFGNHIMPYTTTICDLLISALQLSDCSNITKEPISPMHHVVWKLLKVWLEAPTASAAAYRIITKGILLKQLLRDISIQEKPPEISVQPQGKTKKNLTLNADSKNNFYINENWYAVCNEALKALKRLLYSGGNFLQKNMFQEVLLKIFQITSSLHSSEVFPFPYTDEKCRKNIYEVLLALVVVSKPSQLDIYQLAVGIFQNAVKDCSYKVTSVCFKASAICGLALHPIRKEVPLKYVEDKPNLPSTSSLIRRISGISSEDNYIEDLPELTEEVPEDMPCHSAQSYHNPNDTEMPSSDYAQVDAHYSEQETESQCNGEDLLEIQNTSHSHEDEESEDEGDADEYEDEERSFDEEMNEEIDLQPDHVYIASTGELQEMTPVLIVPETLQSVVEPEYEELRASSSKIQTHVLSSNNSKTMQINGVRNLVPDEDIPVASTENISNENGILLSDEEEVDDEEGDEDEGDEEDELSHRNSEKRVPDLEAPAAKKQKIDACADVGVRQDGRADPRAISPTTEDMKRDFILSDDEQVEGGDVKS